MLGRARPFANDPRAPRDKAGLLVALHPSLSVGQWRDSEMGLAFGRYLFTPAHYHGTVIWSWRQALLAQGVRRQLARSGIEVATRAALETAECTLWRAIDATRGGSTRELWSWAPDAKGRPELRPFGAGPPSGAGEARGLPDADESNAIQLWSTVYLALRPPTPAENPRCVPAGIEP